MENSGYFKVLRACLRERRGYLFFFLFSIGVNGFIFWLYGLVLEPFVYGFLVTAFLGLILFMTSTVSTWRRRDRRLGVLRSVDTEWMNLWEPENLMEEDYHQIIEALGRDMNQILSEASSGRTEMLDYYTTWVHQIKTPISVMHLVLAGTDSQENRMLRSELFRIEQYVEMVLQYIRLGSDTRDLVIKEYDQDDLVRQSIRKFAPQFLQRKLTMDFQPGNQKIMTDQKWFTCIIEQLLSNAVKYTPSGGIRISTLEDGSLKISDTGIGIAPEDLPRIFEKGFTGTNGRGGVKSSGLGLYLCKKAADMMSCQISVESIPGKGTSFYLKQDRWTSAI